MDEKKTLPAGIAVSTLLADDSLTPALRDRIRNADKNNDGILSVAELLCILESERKAQSERKLFLRMLVALGVAVLILIAAVCGAVYGIVHLSQKVDDDNGVMVSASTGEVMSTGTVLASHNVSAIWEEDWPAAIEKVMEMDKLVVPDEEGDVTIYHVSTARLKKNDGTVEFRTTGGDILTLHPENGIVLEGSMVETNGTSAGSRRLLSIENNSIIGVGSQSTSSGGPALGATAARSSLVTCQRSKPVICKRNQQTKMIQACDDGLLTPDGGPFCGVNCGEFEGGWFSYDDSCVSCTGTPKVLYWKDPTPSAKFTFAYKLPEKSGEIQLNVIPSDRNLDKDSFLNGLYNGYPHWRDFLDDCFGL